MCILAAASSWGRNIPAKEVNVLHGEQMSVRKQTHVRHPRCKTKFYGYLVQGCFLHVVHLLGAIYENSIIYNI